MFRRILALASQAAIVHVALIGLAFAQAPASKASAPVSKPVSVTATIEAIDSTLHLVTLKGADGTVSTVFADPAVVKRFDQLKVGDKISATYYDAIAVSVRKPGDPAPPDGGGVMRSTGAKPGATISNQRSATVTVLAMDPKTRAVTVKTQDGRTVSLRVNEQKYFDAVKVGDTVDVTYTEAILLEVTPAK